VTHSTRKSRLFDIECPVTVRLGAEAGNPRELRGVLSKIGRAGAIVKLEEPLETGKRIILFMNTSVRGKRGTTLCFQGIVEGCNQTAPFAVAARFEGSYRFLKDCALPPPGLSSSRIAATAREYWLDSRSLIQPVAGSTKEWVESGVPTIALAGEGRYN